MNFINKLERKFGKYAIRNLMWYIIVLYAFGFVLMLFAPEIYYQYLSLNAEAILHGQIWRIVTFLIQPPDGSILFIIFALYLYYMIGTSLENAWGAFRFNLYFFTGVLLHVIAAIALYLINGKVYTLGTGFLNLSLFFAFAAIYPDMEFLMFFLIPIKVKWLALLDGAFFVVSIIGGFVGGMPSVSIAALVSIGNFLLFYFATRNYQRVSPKEIKRKKKYKQQIKVSTSGPKHKCAVCGRTELDGENLEFRYCSKCDGSYEYCQDHLFTHEHIKKH